MKKLFLTAAMVAGLAFAGGSSAATTILTGGATLNPDGSVTLNSTAPATSAAVSVPTGRILLGDITAFSLSYSFPGGCATGVPELQIMTVRGTIHVSLGAAGLNCGPGTFSTYLLNPSTAVDTHEIVGGTFVDNWGRAHSEYDNLAVTGIQVITTGASQVVTLSNMQLVLTPGAPSASM